MFSALAVSSAIALASVFGTVGTAPAPAEATAVVTMAPATVNNGCAVHETEVLPWVCVNTDTVNEVVDAIAGINWF